MTAEKKRSQVPVKGFILLTSGGQPHYVQVSKINYIGTDVDREEEGDNAHYIMYHGVPQQQTVHVNNTPITATGTITISNAPNVPEEPQEPKLSTYIDLGNGQIIVEESVAEVMELIAADQQRG